MNKVHAGMGRTKNRKSVIHTGMLRVLEQTAEKGEPMREKLIEMLKHDNCPVFLVIGGTPEDLADYLIANGGTVPTGEIDFDYNAEDVTNES